MKPDRSNGGHHLHMRKRWVEEAKRPCSKTHYSVVAEKAPEPRSFISQRAHRTPLPRPHTHQDCLQGYRTETLLTYSNICFHIINYLGGQGKELWNSELKWQEPLLIENPSEMKMKISEIRMEVNGKTGFNFLKCNLRNSGTCPLYRKRHTYNVSE